MRRIHRVAIPLDARLELYRRGKLSPTKDLAIDEWSKYRRSVKSQPVIAALQQMAGIRQRCSYCCDSRSADVDHYVPKATDFHLTFSWPNLIWVCPECNRRKSDRFPLDSSGNPLIIDPTSTNPWDHLILDTANAFMAARFREDGPDAIGETTLDVVACINHEAVIEGRKRIIRRYREAVRGILGCKREDLNRLFGALVREMNEDTFGIGNWFAVYEGRLETEFTQLRTEFPDVWRRFVTRESASH